MTVEFTDDEHVSPHKDIDAPVDNADDLPLIPGADKRQTRVVTYLKLIRQTGAQRGYLGKIPANSTEETISAQFGNGIYTIHACNAKGRVIRERSDIHISVPDSGPEHVASAPVHDPKDAHLANAITAMNRMAEQTTEKVEKLALASAEARERNTESFTSLITSTQENAAQRESERLQAQQRQQETFFHSMVTNQQAMFQQTIAMMTASHQQTLQILTATQERENSQNNPMLMMQMFLQGLQFAKGETEAPEPFQVALKEGSSMLGSLVQLMQGSKALPVHSTVRNPPVSRPSIVRPPVRVQSPNSAHTAGNSPESGQAATSSGGGFFTKRPNVAESHDKKPESSQK